MPCANSPTNTDYENVLYRKDSVMGFAIGGVGMVGKGTGKAGKGGKAHG
jgi:hypothetical protein